MTIAVRMKAAKETGSTMDDHVKKVVEDYVADVLSDAQQMPTQFTGSPYQKTGVLVGGLHFRRAGGGSRAAGLIGAIWAPLSRFASKFVKEGFIERIDQLWAGRGVGWSRSRRGK